MKRFLILERRINAPEEERGFCRVLPYFWLIGSTVPSENVQYYEPLSFVNASSRFAKH